MEWNIQKVSIYTLILVRKRTFQYIEFTSVSNANREINRNVFHPYLCCFHLNWYLKCLPPSENVFKSWELRLWCSKSMSVSHFIKQLFLTGLNLESGCELFQPGGAAGKDAVAGLGHHSVHRALKLLIIKYDNIY